MKEANLDSTTRSRIQNKRNSIDPSDLR
jgi:hypothetical protein